MIELFCMKQISTEELFNKYCDNKKHSVEVQRLSLLIFDEVNAKLKGMSDKKRNLLKSAALLHDIGYSINDKTHHLNSQKLILEEGLTDFTQEDKQIISCISRYHRGELPDKHEHEVYCDLDKKERKAVKRLGGILKIADSLEDEDSGKIKDISLNYDDKNNITEFIITPQSEDFYMNIMRLIKKKNLFEIGFKTQVVFKFVQKG